MPATAALDRPSATHTACLPSTEWMDCIRCRDHHPVNGRCEAVAARWMIAFQDFPNLTYEVAYERALLDILYRGTPTDLLRTFKDPKA